MVGTIAGRAKTSALLGGWFFRFASSYAGFELWMPVLDFRAANALSLIILLYRVRQSRIRFTSPSHYRQGVARIPIRA